MTALIPRADIRAVAAKYDVGFAPATDLPVDQVRGYVHELRVEAATLDHSNKLLAEADDLDALADRYEQAATRA